MFDHVINLHYLQVGANWAKFSENYMQCYLISHICWSLIFPCLGSMRWWWLFYLHYLMAASSGQDRESDWSYPRPGAVLSSGPAPGSGLSLLSSLLLFSSLSLVPASHLTDLPTTPLSPVSAPNAQNSNYGWLARVEDPAHRPAHSFAVAGPSYAGTSELLTSHQGSVSQSLSLSVFT